MNFLRRKKFFIIGIIIIIFVGVFTGIRVKKIQDYPKNYENALNAIAYNTSTDVNIYNLYSQVYQASLIEGKDFSSEMSSLGEHDKSLIDDSIKKAKDKDKEIVNLMQKLKNPPSKYQKNYDELLDVYSKYSKLNNSATIDNKQTFSIQDLSDATNTFKEIGDKAIEFKKLGMK